MKRHQGGYTLIELIIVLAILAILLSIGIYSFNGIKDKMYAEQCTTNRYEIVRSYNIYKQANPNIQIDDVIANKDREYFSGDCLCALGGTYYLSNSSGEKYIKCTLHTDNLIIDGIDIDTPGQIVAKNMYELVKEYEEAAAKGNTALQEFKKKYNITTNAFNNSTFRNILINTAEYNGAWEELSDAFKQANNISVSTKLYVQPYLTHTTNNKDDIIVYANQHSTDVNSWHDIKYIYDYQNNIWYQAPSGKSAMIAGKTWDDIKVQINDEQWTALSNQY